MENKVLVAVSWGPDSMLTAVLTYNFFVTNKCNLKNLFFVHFNHKVRFESDQEEKFIKNYFKGTNLICISRRPTRQSANEQNLRSRRYAELQKIVKKTRSSKGNKINSVILGHNLSDRIESTFLNLLRGAGLKGFLSMEYCDHHPLLPGTTVLRPLINIPKSKITKICDENDIPYVIDTSNDNDETSLRNKLRNKILPALYALSKSQKGKETFENSMLNVYEEIEKIKKTKNLQSAICNLQSILPSPYRKSKFAYQRNITPQAITTEDIIQMLNQLWIYKNISSAFLHELHKFLTTSDSGYKYFQRVYFFVAHGKIYIIQAPQNFRKKYITKKGQDIKNEVQGLLTFDFWPSTILRYPQKTDRYKGKTRNQYCIAQKIPIFRRNFIPVLEKDSKIIKVMKTTPAVIPASSLPRTKMRGVGAGI